MPLSCQYSQHVDMKTSRVYFHIENDVPYDDAVSYLAEGFADLGVECYGSRDYWWDERSGLPLVRKADLKSTVWPVVFVDYLAFRYDHIDESGRYHSRVQVPDVDLLRRHSEVLIHIDLEDGYNDRAGGDRRIDLVYRTKFNKYCPQSEKTRPYVLGAQKRMLNLPTRHATSGANASTILDSFGFTHPYLHTSRKRFRYKLAPLLAKVGIAVDERTSGSLSEPPSDSVGKRWWSLTKNLHNPSFYELVTQYPMHACFCGDIIPAFPRDPTPILQGGNKAMVKRFLYAALGKMLRRPERSIQWDSWRFWETLSLGVVPLLYDLEKMGVVLPVMPQNWVHYVGIDPGNELESIKELARRWDELPALGLAGRNWLNKYYSPIANAQRVIGDISNLRTCVKSPMMST